MKFLIIMRRQPGAQSVRSGVTAEKLEHHATNVRASLEKGNLHFAAALLSGGAAYVVEADNAKDLAYAIKDNPLYKSCSVEIEPIVDADVYLQHAAKAVKKMKG